MEDSGGNGNPHGRQSLTEALREAFSYYTIIKPKAKLPRISCFKNIARRYLKVIVLVLV